MCKLFIPDGPQFFRLMSIDPGTNTMGVSVLFIDLINKRIHLEYVKTLTAAKTLNQYEQYMEIHGERSARLFSHEIALNDLMNHWGIHGLVSESPYLGRFPQAFGALVECMSVIRKAVYTFNPFMTVFTIDPATVKMAVGVSGKSGDKQAMARAVKGLHDFIVNPNINLEDLDEHSIDSAAVGYARAKQMLGFSI